MEVRREGLNIFIVGCAPLAIGQAATGAVGLRALAVTRVRTARVQCRLRALMRQSRLRPGL